MNIEWRNGTRMTRMQGNADLRGFFTIRIVSIQSAAERMKQLIENLLSYSRVNTTEKLFEETDLNQLLQEVKNDLSETI